MPPPSPYAGSSKTQCRKSSHRAPQRSEHLNGSSSASRIVSPYESQSTCECHPSCLLLATSTWPFKLTVAVPVEKVDVEPRKRIWALLAKGLERELQHPQPKVSKGRPSLSSLESTNPHKPHKRRQGQTSTSETRYFRTESCGVVFKGHAQHGWCPLGFPKTIQRGIPKVQHPQASILKAPFLAPGIIDIGNICLPVVELVHAKSFKELAVWLGSTHVPKTSPKSRPSTQPPNHPTPP